MPVWQPGMRVTADRLNDDTPGAWQDVTFVNWEQGGLSYASLRVQADGPRGRLDGHGQPAASFTGNEVAFTIPDGLRPLADHYFNAVRITSGTPSIIGCVVGASGDVTVYTSTTLTSTDRFDFTNIAWPLD